MHCKLIYSLNIRILILVFLTSLSFAIDYKDIIGEEYKPVQTYKTSAGHYLFISKEPDLMYAYGKSFEKVTTSILNLVNLNDLQIGLIAKVNIYSNSISSLADIAYSSPHSGESFSYITMTNPDNIVSIKILDAIGKAVFDKIVVMKSKAGGKYTHPQWFVNALLDNLNPMSKKTNMKQIYQLWKSNKLKKWGYYIDNYSDTEGVSRKVCAVITDMLLHRSDFNNIFNKIITSATNGEQIDASWVYKYCLDNRGFPLSMQMDLWMLRYRRVVYVPGKTFLDDIDFFEDLLNITITKTVDGKDILKNYSFKDAINYKQDKLIRKEALRKVSSINVAVAGKGDDLKKVCSEYEEFLRALNKNKSKRKLEKLLIKADKSLLALKEKYMKTTQPKELGDFNEK